VSNYRVRQVLALGPMPDRQLCLLVALATWMDDHSRVVRVGFDALIAVSGRTHNTIRKARRELEDGGKVITVTGGGRGHLTLWTVLCLPEKGTNVLGPLLETGKGTNPGPERVPTEGQKGYQPELADLGKPEPGLNRSAKPSSSLSRALTSLAEAVPALSEREMDVISDHLKDNPDIPHPGAYLRTVIANGDAAEWAAQALRGGRSPGRHAARESIGDRARRAGEALKTKIAAENGTGPRSEACKRPAHHPWDCGYNWCKCICHGGYTPAANGHDPAGDALRQPQDDPQPLAAIMAGLSARQATP
jgi:hypothetical protein